MQSVNGSHRVCFSVEAGAVPYSPASVAEHYETMVANKRHSHYHHQQPSHTASFTATQPFVHHKFPQYGIPLVTPFATSRHCHRHVSLLRTRGDCECAPAHRPRWSCSLQVCHNEAHALRALRRMRTRPTRASSGKPAPVNSCGLAPPALYGRRNARLAPGVPYRSDVRSRNPPASAALPPAPLLTLLMDGSRRHLSVVGSPLPGACNVRRLPVNRAYVAP
jgi:hypothetical protein